MANASAKAHRTSAGTPPAGPAAARKGWTKSATALGFPTRTSAERERDDLIVGNLTNILEFSAVQDEVRAYFSRPAYARGIEMMKEGSIIDDALATLRAMSEDAKLPTKQQVLAEAQRKNYDTDVDLIRTGLTTYWLNTLRSAWHLHTSRQEGLRLWGETLLPTPEDPTWNGRDERGFKSFVGGVALSYEQAVKLLKVFASRLRELAAEKPVALPGDLILRHEGPSFVVRKA